MASLKNHPVLSEFSLEGFEAPEGLVPVAVYADFSAASDAGLAILAMGKAYWTLLHAGQYVVCVVPADASLVRAELAAIFDLASTQRRFLGTRYLEFSFGYVSFVLYAIILLSCFLWQQAGWPLDLGRGDSLAMITGGEWTRALTSLCLHGDIVHLVSNLVAGMGFAFFVARFFGAAAGWLLILSSGVLGNVLNAWVYFPEPHYSIGASTAVFGALGLLTGVGLWAAISEAQETWLMPRWFVPVFGGMTLLGLTGVGDGSLHGSVDVAAHISGFVCGLLLGLVGAIFQRAFVYLEQQRYWVGLLSVALVALAWALRVS
ncbi:rhomboid family intramembrane serine protease [Coraliomargarita algicola]|uniref:Rhomboid family intramembrane serine protease n=1 Tax=Coraliomargarita algicola TaxID=3092156 RepID=A0ABZ0RRY0_9BACT|nr:rhomboid family intramembrane serine protease [Coraliomargarita sp. J2-16]WPJ97851.1 rhomboid family intramembrane serine protease [Coraliomargarita sp. J2-16]